MGRNLEVSIPDRDLGYLKRAPSLAGNGICCVSIPDRDLGYLKPGWTTINTVTSRVSIPDRDLGYLKRSPAALCSSCQNSFNP